MTIDNGAVTPKAQGEFLKRYAHFEGIDDGEMSIKYYTLDLSDGVPVSKNLRDKLPAGFKVYEHNGEVVQVQRIGFDEAKTLAECTKLKFGGF